mmetsp:Transcript_21444/g.52084  ORF Transcript_21444/g.52084 Transcript_21444/m.52084 type:complete len:87 (+) Transcript_21444:3-263(+)
MIQNLSLAMRIASVVSLAVLAQQCPDGHQIRNGVCMKSCSDGATHCNTWEYCCNCARRVAPTSMWMSGVFVYAGTALLGGKCACCN